MPTTEERLKQVNLKLERAKEHIAELEQEHHSFLISQPPVVTTKREPKERKLVYYVQSVPVVPDRIL